MGRALIIASLDRAGGHPGIIGMVVLVAILAVLVYALVQRGRSRREETQADRGGDRDLEA
jgi:hypothetical protein